MTDQAFDLSPLRLTVRQGVPCERREGGQWATMGVVYRVGAAGVGRWHELPKGYRLSRASRHALDADQAAERQAA